MTKYNISLNQRYHIVIKGTFGFFMGYNKDSLSTDTIVFHNVILFTIQAKCAIVCMHKNEKYEQKGVDT